MIAIDASAFKKMLILCDKLCGTVEPSLRYISFYHRNGLRMRASDGCANLEIFVGISNPFVGVYNVPIDLLKVFMSDIKSEDVVMDFEKQFIIFRAGNEIMRIKTKPVEKLPEKVEFDFLCTVEKSDFGDAVNFASSVLDEGEFLGIHLEGNTIIAYGSTADLLTVYFVPTFSKSTLSIKIPYTTARHVYKFLEHSDDFDLNLGDFYGNLVIKLQYMVLNICGEMASEKEIEKLRKIIGEKSLDRLEARIDIFSRFIRKASGITTRGMKMEISRFGDTLRFSAKSQGVQYSADIVTKEGRAFKVSFSPHKMRSALARMKTKKVYLDITENYLKISNVSGSKIIFIPLS